MSQHSKEPEVDDKQLDAMSIRVLRDFARNSGIKVTSGINKAGMRKSHDDQSAPVCVVFSVLEVKDALKQRAAV